MVRSEFGHSLDGRGFPHARGDGPVSNGTDRQLSLFSPRPWGWSVNTSAGMPDSDVFPTPVGMVRDTANFSPLIACFPHARGDGPFYGLIKPTSQ